jgi:hypothetical protein
MLTEKIRFKRYLLSILPETFTHLEELAREQTRRTGQFITVASLIREAVQETYLSNKKELVK